MSYGSCNYSGELIFCSLFLFFLLLAHHWYPIKLLQFRQPFQCLISPITLCRMLLLKRITCMYIMQLLPEAAEMQALETLSGSLQSSTMFCHGAIVLLLLVNHWAYLQKRKYCVLHATGLFTNMNIPINYIGM